MISGHPSYLQLLVFLCRIIDHFNLLQSSQTLTHSLFMSYIAPDQRLFFFHRKVLIFFLFLHENICCGYSLEAPHWGASNEYPQHIYFLGEIRKLLCGGYSSYLELRTVSWILSPGIVEMWKCCLGIYELLVFLGRNRWENNDWIGTYCRNHWCLLVIGCCEEFIWEAFLF